MFTRLIGFTAFAAAAFSGASFAGEAPENLDLQFLNASSGILDTTGGQYVFDLASCGIWVEEGEYDIEAYGPGVSQDGRKILFEFSAIGRHLSVGLDIDSVFQSASENLTADNLEVEVSGTVVTVANLELRDQDNKPAGSGSLTFNCQPAS